MISRNIESISTSITSIHTYLLNITQHITNIREAQFYIHFEWIKIERVCSKYNDTILCYVSILHENNKNVPKLALLAMTWALQLCFR